MADTTTGTQEPGSDGTDYWEQQKNTDFIGKLKHHSKRFAIGFLILLGISIAMKFMDVDFDQDFDLYEYNITVLTSLRFFWILLFTLYFSYLVPLILLVGINKFMIQLKDDAGGDKHDGKVIENQPGDDIPTETGTTRIDEEGDTSDGDDPEDNDSDSNDNEPDSNNNDPDSDNASNSDSESNSSTDELQDKPGNEDLSNAPDNGGEGERDSTSSKKGEEEAEANDAKNKMKRLFKAIPLFAGVDQGVPTTGQQDAEQAEKLLFLFLHRMILIIGFAYAFLTLGLDLDRTIEVLGTFITAEEILKSILTGLIAVLFALYFLPLFLQLIINVSLRRYAKRHQNDEERVYRVKQEVDKIRPGVQKTLVYLILLIAALVSLSYFNCPDPLIDLTQQDIHFDQLQEETQFCEYLDIVDAALTSMIILMAALFLTTLTPLMIYIMSTSPEDIRKSNVYKAGRYINYIILLIAMFLIMDVVGLDLSTSVSIGESKITLWSIISALMIIILANIIAKMICAILRDTALNPKQIDEHAAIVMEKLIHVVIVLIGIAIAMGTLGINILAIATGLGLIGFALAFGMQDTIANLMAGVMIAIERPFQIGDRIRVGDEWGDVIDIGMRSTKIRTTKNETVLIPNNLVVTREVWNFTKDSPVIACVVPIGISYDSNWEAAEEVILDVARAHQLVITNPAPKILLKDYADSSVNYELWAYINNARQMWGVRSDILKTLRLRFHEEGIEIPYPHRTLVLKKDAASELSDTLQR